MATQKSKIGNRKSRISFDFSKCRNEECLRLFFATHGNQLQRCRKVKKYGSKQEKIVAFWFCSLFYSGKIKGGGAWSLWTPASTAPVIIVTCRHSVCQNVNLVYRPQSLTLVSKNWWLQNSFCIEFKKSKQSALYIIALLFCFFSFVYFYFWFYGCPRSYFYFRFIFL